MVDIEFPPIFCIYNSPKEKREMEKEFNSLGIGEVVNYIKAPTKEDSIIDYYSHGLHEEDISRDEVRIYVSHLTALRALINSKSQRGFICESGIKLNSNFLSMYCEKYSELLEAPLVSLSGKQGCLKFYLVTQEYAVNIISSCDKPFSRIQREELRHPSSIVTCPKSKVLGNFLIPVISNSQVIRYDPLVLDIDL